MCGQGSSVVSSPDLDDLRQPSNYLPNELLTIDEFESSNELCPISSYELSVGSEFFVLNYDVDNAAAGFEVTLKSDFVD